MHNTGFRFDPWPEVRFMLRPPTLTYCELCQICLTPSLFASITIFISSIANRCIAADDSMLCNACLGRSTDSAIGCVGPGKSSTGYFLSCTTFFLQPRQLRCHHAEPNFVATPHPVRHLSPAVGDLLSQLFLFPAKDQKIEDLKWLSTLATHLVLTRS